MIDYGFDWSLDSDCKENTNLDLGLAQDAEFCSTYAVSWFGLLKIMNIWFVL